jgi:hypothetical protein
MARAIRTTAGCSGAPKIVFQVIRLWLSDPERPLAEAVVI